ncbi:WD repeat protein [Talaromyces proteolyticus]|uniref:ASTRA-associated protein 1 n=1 Tax=Talaromyces proteolyticus TaxID=1131652 RepID=A0AAD4L2K2_9EURO|nr:WD repeat protein [Talaromyces proteolyticus]KAH8705456.1 WD repeat protein [Talaromyces proteolyticus]
MSTIVEQSNPPATPRYILRGHASAIHALHFFAGNTRLISADAEGWIVVWDVTTKRPRAVWKAHEGAVLEVKGYMCSGQGMEIFTHGRDHKLRVWRIKSSADELLLNRILPVERNQVNDSSRREVLPAEPWLVHSLPVNALNFCAFSLCYFREAVAARAPEVDPGDSSRSESVENALSVYFAVPNALNSGAIDIFHLPSEKRVSTIAADTSIQTGMVMAVNILLTTQNQLYVLSGYEDGQVMVHIRRSITDMSTLWKWERIYVSRPHSQPVLSLDSVNFAADKSFFLTSSADSLIVKHPISSVDSLGPTAAVVETTPLKVLNTKHSGQQGLRVREDQKIFATAGWDSRIRVYSCKTMKELAVLKWHKEGCYAVAFAEVLSSLSNFYASNESNTAHNASADTQVALSNESPLQIIQSQRSQKAQQMHWLAAGSKDGKISLWDIY